MTKRKARGHTSRKPDVIEQANQQTNQLFAELYGTSPMSQALADLKAFHALPLDEQHQASAALGQQLIEHIRLTVRGNCGRIHASFEEWQSCRACDPPARD
jgi:hypothetical protein